MHDLTQPAPSGEPPAQPTPRRPHSIADQPATVKACAADRAAAKGPGAARDQLALARATTVTR